MKKKRARIFTLVLSLALLVSVCVLSFPALAGSGAESTGTDITGVKFSTIGAGANELKIFCTVEPATLTTGNYWEGTIKEVITQEELDAFTTKIRINDKTLKEWMDTGYIRYLPATSAGQLDIVFKNSGDFLNFGDYGETITFEKGCKLPGVAALAEEISYKFTFTSGAETVGKRVVNTPSTTEATTEASTEASTEATTKATTSPSIITPPTTDAPKAEITWTGVNTYSENYYIVHLNVSPKTLTAGQKYYDNGEIVMDSEAWSYQFADYIFFNGYSFKDLIEKDPDIFVGIQASNGRTDNLEFTLSPAALAKNKVPYFGTTGKGETIDLRAGCLLPNGTEIKENGAWVVTPGKPQGVRTSPSAITKEPVHYYPDGSATTGATTEPTTEPTTAATQAPQEEHTFTFEGTLVDADGKALGGVSMSIHGDGTQTIVTEDDGSFLLLDMQSGSKTFLVIRNGAVSTMVIEMKEAVNAAKAALSADGKVLTLPSKAKTLSMKLMLNKDNSLSVNSVEVIKWVDGYQPPAGGDDSAETDGSDSGETGPETGVPLALGAVLALALAVTVLAVTGRAEKQAKN